VLVYFGYPKAHEDDAERAVKAGLAGTIPSIVLVMCFGRLVENAVPTVTVIS
jgi:hypothetical protein